MLQAMVGIQYKDTFAAKGSDLYEALQAKDAVKIKQTYSMTTARAVALLAGLQVPKLVIGTEGKSRGTWGIFSDDAQWTNDGKLAKVQA